MWFNPIVRSLLRSPLHFLMSRNTLLMTYAGRRSGHVYTTPMNYVRDGDTFFITSLRTHTWWRNLRGRALVELRVQGKDLRAYAEVVEGGDAVVDELRAYFRKAPALAPFYGVKHAPPARWTQKVWRNLRARWSW
jgi:deazaflavin-dependent oxidoreductase (nitroreductase family)